MGDGRGTGLPSADTRPAENRPGMGRRLGWGDARDGETPGMGRRPRRVMCGLRLMGVTVAPWGSLGQMVGSSEAEPL